MNNNNTSGSRQFESSGTNGDVNDDKLGKRIINNFVLTRQLILNEITQLRRENTELKNQIKQLKFENVQSKIEIRILDIDKTKLEEKYKGSSDALQKALQEIKDLRNDKNKKGVPNVNSIQVSVGQNNSVSLPEKIKSFKNDLKPCKTVDYSYNGNNKSNNVFSVDQNNSVSLLEKIQSFKNDLKPCKTVDYSYNGNNKSQQTK